MPTPKSSAMVGSEMLTMLPLMVLMKAPTDTAESTSHFRFFGEESCPEITSNLLSCSYQRARASARVLDRYPFAEPLTPLVHQQYRGAPLHPRSECTPNRTNYWLWKNTWASLSVNRPWKCSSKDWGFLQSHVTLTATAF